MIHLIQDHFRDFFKDWNQNEPFDWRATLACVVGGIILWPLTSRLPVLGWDWYFAFHPNKIQQYPPWAEYIFSPLTMLPWRSGLGLLNGLMLMTLAVATAREAFHSKYPKSTPVAVLLALFTPPPLFLLWQGNVDGIILLGLVAAPSGMILALLKPNLSIWTALANRQRSAWAFVILLVSLVLWGMWPLRTLQFFYEAVNSGHSALMGWYNLGWPLALLGGVLLLLSNADPLRLMAAGYFLSPYLMPNHFLLLIPALGRVNGWKRWFLWCCAWLVAIATGMLGSARYLALIFPLAVWWLLRDCSKRTNQP